MHYSVRCGHRGLRPMPIVAFVPQPCQISFLGPDEILHFLPARNILLLFSLLIQLVLNHKLNQILIWQTGTGLCN